MSSTPLIDRVADAVPWDRWLTTDEVRMALGIGPKLDAVRRALNALKKEGIVESKAQAIDQGVGPRYLWRRVKA